MAAKANRILNILMGSCFGVFLGHGLYVWWDYRTHPLLYAAASAPWYTGILFYGAATLAVLAACLLLKAILRKKLRQ